MKFQNLSSRALLSLILAAQVAVSTAAVPVIGVANAKGSFKLNQSTVTGNGTVLEGTTVETSIASSTVQLSSGGQVRLGADSRGKIFMNRLILEKGAGRVTNSGGYLIETRNLQIIADGPDSIGHVQVKGGNTVLVAALKGNVRVRTANGTPIASMAAGRVLEFAPQAGAAGPSTLTGCVALVDGHFYMTDETTGLSVELQGGDTGLYVGRRIEIMGATIPSAKPAGGASQVIQVNQIKELNSHCTIPAGAIGAGAGAAAAAGSGAASGGGATTAIVAGVIVAAAATGTAVAITSNDDDPDPISQ